MCCRRCRPPMTLGSDDPVLTRYGDALGGEWLGYLSSTGVYGDTGGAWVDESAATGGGRRDRPRPRRCGVARAGGAWVFRLPGIYGPRPLAAGAGARGDGAPGRHAPIRCSAASTSTTSPAGVVAAFAAPAGAYNLADDAPCPQNEVVEYAARPARAVAPPPLCRRSTMLSPMARGFYAENRRVANAQGEARARLERRAIRATARACARSARSPARRPRARAPIAREQESSDSPRTRSTAASRSPARSRWNRPPSPARSRAAPR